jgi:Fe-S-cluster containining protein
MLCSHCGKCCEETEMELSLRDIEKLELEGYDARKFSIKDDDEVIHLKNVDGRCYFYDVVNKQCSVYEKRPQGCYIYPVVYIINQGLGIDDLCPMGDTISPQEFLMKGKILIKILKKMEKDTKIKIFTP